MTNKQKLARKNSNGIRKSFLIKDWEYRWILLLKKDKDYAYIAKKEGKAWTKERVKGQMKKVYAKLNKNRAKNLPRINSHHQILEVLEMIIIKHLF
ncbi:MAG: hypothetical protein WCG32_02760 [Actinomycetes bacterium]